MSGNNFQFAACRNILQELAVTETSVNVLFLIKDPSDKLMNILTDFIRVLIVLILTKVSLYDHNLVWEFIFKGYFLLFYFSVISQFSEKSQKSEKVKKKIMIPTKKFL